MRTTQPIRLSNLSERINHNIVQSEIEGGVYLYDLPQDSSIEVKTENRSYVLVVRGRNEALISGHPDFCPQPVLVNVHGSTWGGSMLKVAFIGRGMHLEFRHPQHRVITTSRIVEVRQVV